MRELKTKLKDMPPKLKLVILAALGIFRRFARDNRFIGRQKDGGAKKYRRKFGR